MDHRPPRPDQPYAWDDERLSAYLDGELSAPEQAQLEARLVVDPELRQLVDELRAVRQQLEILPEYRLKPTFADQVLRRAEQEMLLGPLGHETTEPLIAAAAPLVPAGPTPVQPAEPALPVRSAWRRWRRGAIWTAVAAAAVLLLMVTNRPNAPQQEHVARNELPDVAMAKAPVGKKTAAPAASPDSSDKDPHHLNTLAKGKEHEGLAKGDNQESQQAPAEQALPAQTTVVGNAGNSPPISAASPFGTAAAAPYGEPQQDAAANRKQDANPLWRTTGDSKPKANQLGDSDRQAEPGSKNQEAGVPGKNLLKSQAPGQRNGVQEKQTAAQRGALSPELAALLASDEFSQLASADKNHPDQAAEEEVLIVYMTPRDELLDEGSFAAVLANNSIGLAEKPLQPAVKQQLQNAFALSTAQGHDAKPLAKAAPQDEQVAGAKDGKEREPREAEKPLNGPALRKETTPPPANDPSAATTKAPANELYYLEADANQVDALLRQLRSSSAQFSRINVKPRALKLAEKKTLAQDEKSIPHKPAASAPQAAKVWGDDARAEGTPLMGNQQSGKQDSGDFKQLAQRAAPAAPAAPASPTGGALPPVPALPTPAAEPSAAPAPDASKEIAAGATPATMPSDAPTAEDGTVPAGAGNGSAGKSSHDFGNRRAMPADKAQKETGDRAIAYRLRGVEALVPEKKVELTVEAFNGGGAGGGAAMRSKAEVDKLKDDAAKRGNAPRVTQLAKPADARTKSSVENGELRLDNKAGEIKQGNVVPTSPPAEKPAAAPGPGITTQEKKLEQPQRQAVASDEPMPNEIQQRQLMRSKAEPNAEELSLPESSALAGAVASAAVSRHANTQTESAKKAAASPAAKRVRVLFVIEHEGNKE